jgi:4'-phosphopantetheinyl transferase
MTNVDPLWSISDEVPQLVADEVQVWLLRLDVEEACFDRCRNILDGDEQQRAARFLHDRARRRFVACRGQLRMILAHCLDEDPKNLRFVYGPFGKPQLGNPACQQLRFNVSHCRDLALMAVAAGRQVGIDLECVRPLANLEGMVQHCLAPQERATWHALPPEERLGAFFRAWTGKEAVLKLLGRGLSFPLDSIKVLARSALLERVVRVPSWEHAGARQESLISKGTGDVYRVGPIAKGTCEGVEKGPVSNATSQQREEHDVGSISKGTGAGGGVDVSYLEGFTPVPGFSAAVAVQGTEARLSFRCWAVGT